MIITGEGEKLEAFLEKNPVLMTKINKKVEFENYDVETLLEITEKELKTKVNLEMNEEIKKSLKEKMDFLYPIKENAH